MDVESELSQLWKLPKYVTQTTQLMGAEMKLLDGPSFVSQYRQIVINESYFFETDLKSPVIIDGGANIGVSTLWWRWKWPEAKIIALEPDPHVFECLRWNLRFHPDLDLRNFALAETEGMLSFHSEGSDGGHLITSAEKSISEVKVPTIKLSTLLVELERVDFLKLDIEGAELSVLSESESELFRVENVFVEYHSFKNSPQELSTLISIFERNGFRYYIEDESKKNRPLSSTLSPQEMDLQLDIWAWRE